MIDKDAFKELTKFVAIAAAAEAVNCASHHKPLALPDDFKLHDIEPYLRQRRRARGTMETSVIGDFAAYIGANKEPGATCFIEQQRMQAVAVLNLGEPLAPGHADNLAKLSLRATAAYEALRRTADGNAKSQRSIAEFLEDWPGEVSFYRDAEEMTAPAAIAAVRDITIEKLNKTGAVEQNLGAERTTFESIAAAGEKPLPTHIYFKTVPFLGLSERTFVMRLGLHTGDKAPSINLKIITLEKHTEQMATEMASIVHQALQGSVPVVVGSYQPKP